MIVIKIMKESETIHRRRYEVACFLLFYRRRRHRHHHRCPEWVALDEEDL
jgi:hypothetical protein